MNSKTCLPSPELAAAFAEFEDAVHALVRRRLPAECDELVVACVARSVVIRLMDTDWAVLFPQREIR